DQRALLEVTAIRNYHSLPSKYQSLNLAASERVDSRGATMVLVDIRQNWDKLSTATQQAITAALGRLPADSVYYSPSGFFKFHYDLTGTNAVPAEDSDSDGVPDFVERCASYCDTALAEQQLLGYLMPPSDGTLGGDDKFDVYFQETGYYGYSVPEGPGPQPWNDYYSYLVLNNDFLGFPSNHDPEGSVAGAAKVTCAHEFHHCVQFAYDINEGSWFMELDATYAEDLTFNQVDDNYNYLDMFMNSPQTSLMDNSDHKYGCFIWDAFLAEKFDTTLLVSLWEGARYKTIMETLADTLAATYGWTPDSAAAEFCAWNYCTAERDDGMHYEEGATYEPSVSIGRSHTVYPVPLQNSPASVAGYGSCYVTFYPGSKIGKLHVMFNGSDTRKWGAYVIKSISPASHTFEKIVLSPVTYQGDVTIPNFENYYSITLVGVNTTEASSGALFTYSANVILPYEVSSKIVTTDSLIYSGATRMYEYQVFNPSIINDVFNAIVSDDNGWVTPDTLDRAIPAGDSTIFTFPIHPPQGTPVGASSTIHFKAQSWGDSTITDSQSTVAYAVLQRGDVNFDGTLDVSDLIYMVEYSFASGPDPLPTLEAADFDCNGTVDVADLISLVEYSFSNGPAPPCNPY
ncbi:MAG TPA: dockerin type I repeat-containing protein, partial [candidate division Zixibacteria bacterium]|nr:dockerin type I repeat-containing protein [candidate division Zixibacteria bacterium]